MYGNGAMLGLFLEKRPSVGIHTPLLKNLVRHEINILDASIRLRIRFPEGINFCKLSLQFWRGYED